nr:hypothetical protein [Tanacetum cinerariifolium]
MSTPTFAETHKLIAFLEKPTESDGFELIVDFLNANLIKYALTDVRLQALVDGNKVIINEALDWMMLKRKHKSRNKQRKEIVVSQYEPPTEEHIPIPSYDPLHSGEDRLQLNELMEICTKLSDRVLSLEQNKTNQATEIKKLKKKVKKLEGKCWELNVYILSIAKIEVSTANAILVLLKVIQQMAKLTSAAIFPKLGCYKNKVSTTIILDLSKDVIENGNSFKPVAKTTTDDAGTSTTLIPGPVTIKEKAKKKNDIKASSMLLMALPNEYLMTFNQYKNAKTLFANTHVVVWRNKSNLDIMSLDDPYNNFKIFEQEVRGTISTNINSQNMAFVSSPSPNSTNEVPTDFGVSTASPHVSTAKLIDATMYAFLANQPNGSQRVHEDLEQIHEDDLEEMDLKWPLALLMNVEDPSSKKMVAIDEASFNWSYMADDEAPTNMAFMALSDSEVWRPIKLDSASIVLKKHTYIDARGNISYLTDFKEFDGGYVVFRGGAKGGKITGKGTIKTDV